MNLIICCTPLQVLIAEKIIDLYPNEKFYGILIYPEKNSKYIYYYNRLAKKCEKTQYIDYHTKNQFKSFLYFLKKGFELPKMKRIFLASINITSLHRLIWKYKNALIYTFDDGSINILEKNLFLNYYSTKYDFLKKIPFFLMQLDTAKSILKRKKLHYSIYKEKNIMGKTQYIELFPNYDFQQEITKTKTILLGQPIYGSNTEGNIKNQQLFEKIATKFSVDYYFPHPRENYKINNVTYIQTDFIFEDYILQEIEKNRNTKYVIYTISSSCALNLHSNSNLEIQIIYPEDCPEHLKEIYTIFEKRELPITNINIKND